MPILILITIALQMQAQNYIGTSKEPAKGNIYHTGGNLGIGTNTPQQLLEIYSSPTFNIPPSIRLSYFNYSVRVNSSYWDITNNRDLKFSRYYDNAHGISYPYQTIMTLSKEGQLILGTETAQKSAIFQLESTSKGVLLPHLTTSQIDAIINPVNGLLVYNSETNLFEYYNNGTWSNIITASFDFSKYLLKSDFQNSTSGQITSQQVNNWNDSYTWGNHATAGYVTASSTTTLTNKSGNISMWTNDAGYIKAADINQLWQNNGNNIYYNSGNVGIGTSSPQKTLQLQKDDNKPTLRFLNDNNGRPNYYDIVQNVDQLQYIYGDDDRETNVLTITPSSICVNGYISIKNPGELWTLAKWHPVIKTSLGSVWTTTDKTSQGYTLGLGMTTSGWYFIEGKDDGSRSYPFRVDLTGFVFASGAQIQVQSWSDFVFNKDYKLMPLDTLAQFIDSTKHLPEVPSENDVKENGIDVGQMQTVQMQKIEELTLYILELNKTIQKQQQEIDELKKNVKHKITKK